MFAGGAHKKGPHRFLYTAGQEHHRWRLAEDPATGLGQELGHMAQRDCPTSTQEVHLTRKAYLKSGQRACTKH